VLPLLDNRRIISNWRLGGNSDVASSTIRHLSMAAAVMHVIAANTNTNATVTYLPPNGQRISGERGGEADERVRCMRVLGRLANPGFIALSESDAGRFER
jgi:hypothetical protein